MRLWRWSIVFLLAAATAAFGDRLSFEEHAAVQESLSRVHPRMRARWLAERGIEDPYYTGVRSTDSGQGLREVGRWSFGPSYDVDGRVTPSETLVALARGSGVSLLRFSRRDSLSIELLSDINAEGLMCRVKVVDTLVYVGSRKGLEVYNIADERKPVRLSWTPLPLNDFDVQDSLAYTISGGYTDSGGDDSFRIYNVSNPVSPVFRGACRDSGDLVSVAGHAAFLGDRWGLYVIDVTNPASPHRIGSWGSAIEQVQARGHLCYVTTFNPTVPGEITFHVLDATVPASPYQLGSLDSVGGYDVYFVDTLAFCSGDADLPRFSIVSVADSTRPYAVSTANEPGWGWGAWTSGLAQAAFIGCHRAGLQVFDTRNTALPVRDTGLLGADQAVDIDVDGGRVYVADYNAGLQILDVSVPSRPMLLAQYDSSRTVRSATARDSFAFVSWPWPRMITLDVTDPTDPLRAAGCDGMFAYPEDMVLRDSLVYCAEMNRFQIVDVARPRKPVLVGSCVTQDGVYFGLAMQDTLAYLISGTLQVIDVADPTSPTIIGTTGVFGAGLAVRDTFVYVPYGYDTLRVYSAADPHSPRLLGFAPLQTHTWDVALAESVAAVATFNGLEAFSLESPGQPRWRAAITTPYGPRRVVYSAPYFYAAMWEAGVGIYSAESLGLQEQAAPFPLRVRLKVFPNPVRDRCLVSLGAVEAREVRLRDVAGRVVPAAVAQFETDEGLSLDLSKLAAGVYFVEVETDGRTARVKLVKQ
jgi:hypothetical protein